VSAAILNATGIVKRYGNTEVLSGVDLQAETGRVLAVVGPSGCGKSTLLNILSGLLAPDGGQLLVAGVPAQRFGQWQRVAYMFQEDRLLPWRSVHDNVAFGLEASALGRTERRERAQAALALVGLADVAQAWPHELSGGMRSRVALARSLAVRPDVLLMDEPFSKLDPQTRAQMHEELLRIQAASGTTVVFVTHDMEEAVVLADRIVRLRPNPGRVADVVDLTALARPRDPVSPLVAERVRALREAMRAG
jgi:NitT/TauT family transport system ATP-binding protein